MFPKILIRKYWVHNVSPNPLPPKRSKYLDNLRSLIFPRRAFWGGRGGDEATLNTDNVVPVLKK